MGSGRIPVHQAGKLPVVGVEPLEEVGFEIPLGILVRSKEGNTVPGIIEVAAVEMGLRPHCRGVDDRRRVILDGDHGVLDIRPVEGLEGLVEVLCHSVIVNHQAVVLLGEHLLVLMGEPPVHPGHRLEEAVLSQRAAQVEHLLDRRVEPCEQHVHDHQDIGLTVRVDEGVGDLVLVEPKGILEFRAVVG